jgi:DnaJ-class molecular chaperone
MTTQEALNILKPAGNTLDDLKTAKRDLAKKYHPDINPSGLERFFDLLTKSPAHGAGGNK